MAVKYESAPKRRARLREILEGYIAGPRVAEVRYYVTRPATRGLLEEVVREYRAEHIVRVQPWM